MTALQHQSLFHQRFVVAKAACRQKKASTIQQTEMGGFPGIMGSGFSDARGWPLK